MRRLLPFLATASLVLVIAPEVRAQKPMGLYVGGAPVKLSREVCARKAVEVMGVKEKFLFAEVTPDGHAQGWTEKVTVLVLSFPTPDPERVLVMVVAAGTDQAETIRLRDAIRQHVFDGPDNPKTPARIGPDGSKIPARAITLSWKSEAKPATPILKHFNAVTALTLEKKGFATNTDGTTLVFGARPQSSVAAFLATTDNAQSYRINVVSAVPGNDPAEKLAEDLLSRIVKVLYE